MSTRVVRRLLLLLLFGVCAHGSELKLAVAAKSLDAPAARALAGLGVARVVLDGGQRDGAAKASLSVARQAGLDACLMGGRAGSAACFVVDLRPAPRLAEPDLAAECQTRFGFRSEAAAPGSVEHGLVLKLKGEAALRRAQVLKQKGGKVIALVPVTALRLNAATTHFLDLAPAVEQGWLDEVWLDGIDRHQPMLLKLRAKHPLQIWQWLDMGQFDSVKLGQVRSIESLDGIVLAGGDPDPVALVKRFRGMTEAFAAHEARMQALQQALASGKFMCVAGLDAKHRNNQATVHGVAQQFRPSASGACRLVRVFATIRGGTDPALPALTVRLLDRPPKEAGKPLASAKIEPWQFALEPNYRWGVAAFEPAVPLERGKDYWLHLPHVAAGGVTYVWGCAKPGKYDAGQGWSRRYDYSQMDWIFEVYVKP